jgi:hypothetical protein
VQKTLHKLRWNPDLEEWFCCACGRTSDHKTKADARAELESFDCKIVGVQNREWTDEEITKWRVTKKTRGKFQENN